MSDWISIDLNAFLKVIIATFLVFFMLIVFARISGLRSFAKMTLIDFASTIAIGSIIASTILNDSPSVFKGSLAIAAILTFQTLFSKLILKWYGFQELATNKPIFLMKGEEIIYENLYKTNMTEGHLMAKLREANVLKLSQVQFVVLETTGDVSVLHSEDKVQVDEQILLGVKS